MASSRCRSYAWAKRVSQNGYPTKILYSRRDAFNDENAIRKIIFIIKLVFYSYFSNTMIFHKYIPPRTIQKIIFRSPIIFDFDDRIYTTKKLKNKKSRFTSFLHSANSIIVSSGFLKDEILSCYGQLENKITVIPTLVDLRAYQSACENKITTGNKNKFRIGWIGTSSSFQYLKKIEDSICRLLKEFEHQVEFEIVSDRSFRFESDNCSVINTKWDIDQEIKYFTRFDVTIMPLDDSNRARGKAAFKAIQSLAANVPVIASAVGFNVDIIKHGQNGFLAENYDQFYHYLKKMILDRSILETLRRNARSSVQHMDYSNWSTIYFDTILDHPKFKG